MNTFNLENVFVGIRYFLTALGSGMAGDSFSNGSKFQFWAGIALAAAAAAYGQFKTTTAQQIKTVDSLSEVRGVVVNAATAGTVDSPTVTTLADMNIQLKK